MFLFFDLPVSGDKLTRLGFLKGSSESLDKGSDADLFCDDEDDELFAIE